MNAELSDYLADMAGKTEVLTEARKDILRKLSDYCGRSLRDYSKAQVNFICTHNSRRSQFAQALFSAAAAYLHVTDLVSFSGGTEVTRFHQNAKLSLERAGFEFSVSGDSDNLDNPVFITHVDERELKLFSKMFDHNANPSQDFAAVMVCSDAAANCPLVPGCDIRIALTIDDPKAADGSPQVMEIYDACRDQLAVELLYVLKNLSRE